MGPLPQRPSPANRLALALAVALGAGPARGADRPSGPIRAVLIAPTRATDGLLDAWKARGIGAVVAPIDESTRREDWSALAGRASARGLAPYAWIEVGRSPAMADAHPDWMAALGLHDDWRARFPGAPKAGAGEVVKAWPWVPIGSAPALEAHRLRVERLLDAMPGPWAGVFLHDLQAGPSSCGCGNDQCRWAIDYGRPSTAARAPGDDQAARLVAALAARYPGKAIVPAWATECEAVDMPRAPGGTGLCGSVECAKNDCWPRYARMWNPLVEAAPGPLAVALWSGPFRRDPAWAEAGLSLFLEPPRGGRAIDPKRAVAILQGWDRPEAELARLIASARRAEGGWVVALDRVEQGWEPRVVKVPPAAPAGAPAHAGAHGGR